MRAVVATRAPRDSGSWLHDAGLKPMENRGPAPRLVSPGNRVAVSAQQDLSNRHEASEHGQPMPASVCSRAQQTGPEPSRSQEQRADAQASTASVNHQVTVERIRPPPPPTFNEWRGQQAKASEARAQAAPVSTLAQHVSASTQASRATEPTAMSTERRSLPGEPAMKLRIPAAASAAGHNGSRCKERECR